MDLGRLQARATQEIEAFRSDQLQRVGLERTLDTYYLIGPYPPLAAMQTPAKDLIDVALSGLRQSVDLYIHFPFCRVMGPYECSFCHFYKERHEIEAEDRYIEGCIKELALYKRRLGSISVRSIYFGGGTFSLIAPRNLERLLGFIWHELQVEPGAEVKFEIHADANRTPGMLNDLLSGLKQYPVTHIVIDIQSLNEDSLRAVSWGRVRPGDYFDTLAACASHGFDRFVTGLILGLPFESFETFMRSVFLLATMPQVTSINLFPLMFRSGDLVHEQFRSLPEMFATVWERDVMHQGARALLSSFGFHESPIYFMNRNGARADHQTSKFQGNPLLAIGASSFGLLCGDVSAQYYNVPSVERYLQLLAQDVLPIWRIGPLSDQGWAIRSIILECLNLNQPYDMTRLDPVIMDQILPLVEFFCHLGLVDLNEGWLALTAKGLLRAEEMSYFVAEPYVREALSRAPACDSASRYNYFITRSREQDRLFHEGLASYRKREKLD